MATLARKNLFYKSILFSTILIMKAKLQCTVYNTMPKRKLFVITGKTYLSANVNYVA